MTFKERYLNEETKKVKKENKPKVDEKELNPDSKAKGREELNPHVAGEVALKEIAKDPDHVKHAALEENFFAKLMKSIEKKGNTQK